MIANQHLPLNIAAADNLNLPLNTTATDNLNLPLDTTIAYNLNMPLNNVAIDYYNPPISFEDTWAILSDDHATPLSTANYSGQLNTTATDNLNLPLDTAMAYNLNMPLNNVAIDYYNPPISFEDNWAILSDEHATPLSTANYSGQFLPQEEDWRQHILPGTKFRPTDKELIVDYLYQFIFGKVPGGFIPFVDIYDYPPDQLQDFTSDHGDAKMYFFTRIKKIGKSKTDRCIKSKNGCYWRATQALKPVEDENGSTIGYKMPLTYIHHKNKTSWLMSEYRLHYSSSSKLKDSPEEFVLAVVYPRNKALLRDPSGSVQGGADLDR